MRGGGGKANGVRFLPCWRAVRVWGQRGWVVCVGGVFSLPDPPDGGEGEDALRFSFLPTGRALGLGGRFCMWGNAP